MKYLSTVWGWLKSGWAKFEAWVDSWMPGYKTLMVNALSAVAAGSTMLASYLKEVPLDAFITANKLAVVMLVVTSLSFWLKGIGDRVEAREEASA